MPLSKKTLSKKTLSKKVPEQIVFGEIVAGIKGEQRSEPSGSRSGVEPQLRGVKVATTEI